MKKKNNVLMLGTVKFVKLIPGDDDGDDDDDDDDDDGDDDGGDNERTVCLTLSTH